MSIEHSLMVTRASIEHSLMDTREQGESIEHSQMDPQMEAGKEEHGVNCALASIQSIP